MRVLRKKEYRHIYSIKKREVGQYILVDKVYRGPNYRTRLGIVVSTRYGKAHQRNHFKRLTREVFRLSYPTLPKGWDFVVRPRTAAAKAALIDIKNEFLQLT